MIIDVEKSIQKVSDLIVDAIEGMSKEQQKEVLEAIHEEIDNRLWDLELEETDDSDDDFDDLDE